MARAKDVGERTTVQLLPELMEDYISRHGVQLKFTRNDLNKGIISPEFDFVFFYPPKDEYGIPQEALARRITLRALSCLMETSFSQMNYDYTLGKIMVTLTSIAWHYFLREQEYPTWLAEMKPVGRRPVGRPRKNPRLLTYNPDVKELVAAEGLSRKWVAHPEYNETRNKHRKLLAAKKKEIKEANLALEVDTEARSWAEAKGLAINLITIEAANVSPEPINTEQIENR